MAAGSEMQVLVDIYVDRLEGTAACFETGERLFVKWTHLMKSGMSRVCTWENGRAKFEDVFPTFVTVFTKDGAGTSSSDGSPASDSRGTKYQYRTASSASSSSVSAAAAASGRRASELYHSKRIVFALYLEGKRHPNAKNSFLINGFLDRPTQKVSIHFKWDDDQRMSHHATLMVKMRVRRDYFDGDYGGEVPDQMLQENVAWERASVTSQNSVKTDNLSCCSTLSGRMMDSPMEKPLSPEETASRTLRGYSKYETLKERNARLEQQHRKTPKLPEVRKQNPPPPAPSPWLLQWIDNFRPNSEDEGAPESSKAAPAAAPKQRICCFF